MQPVDYLAGFPAGFRERAQAALLEGSLELHLGARYPAGHGIQTNAQLERFVKELKQRYLQRAPNPSKIVFDDRLTLEAQALGLNTRIARVQGARLVAKREIRVAGLFREAPLEFLRAVVVHELAHLKEFEHGAAFYRLCQHMEPDYPRLEQDLFLWLAVRAQARLASRSPASPSENPPP